MTTESTATPAQQIAAGYAVEGQALELGTVVVDGVADPTAQIRIPLATVNRHGLVAGATGTGKTKSLQVIAEQLSAAGVPVMMADVKGDLSGLSRPGEAGDKITERAKDTGDTWTPTAYPVEFLSLGTSGIGVPVRATISSFGPILLSKVLGLNATQESTLGLIFHWADQKGLPLLDLKDLRSVITFLTSDEGKPELKALGAVSSTTAGVILRALVNLEAEGADTFFGEPELEPKDLLRVDAQGRGIITLLELGSQAARPVMFSTFLMWVLADLFTTLPEVGDVDKPKLVFFFDEAHLLFTDASKAFLEQVEQTVKLIRSKGVGVFFCTQLPTDVPNDVLSPARRPHPARAARVHPGRPEGADQDGAHLPENRCLRPGVGVDVAGYRRGDRHRAVGEGRADAGGVDQDARPALADGHHRSRRDRRRRQGQPAAGRIRPDHRPRFGLRTAGRQARAATAGAARYYRPAAGAVTDRGAADAPAGRAGRARFLRKDDEQSGVQERDALGGHRDRPRDHPQHLRHRPPSPLGSRRVLRQGCDLGRATTVVQISARKAQPPPSLL